MSFEEFKKMTYHTRLTVRIPGSRTIISKEELMLKGKFDTKKLDTLLKNIYESENYENR